MTDMAATIESPRAASVGIFSAVTAVRQLKLLPAGKTLITSEEEHDKRSEGSRSSLDMVAEKSNMSCSSISDSIVQDHARSNLAERNAFLLQLEGTYLRNNDLSQTLESICELMKVYVIVLNIILFWLTLI